MTNVTLLVRTKDRAELLARALDSVERQDCDVVVAADPNATDAVYDVVRDRDVRLVKCKRSGIGAAWNEGMTACDTGFVRIFDDDDVFLPDGVEKIRRFIKSDDATYECLTTFEDPRVTLHDDRCDIHWPRRCIPEDVNTLSYEMRERMLLRRKLYYGGFLYHTDTYDRLGMVLEGVTMYEDYEWALRAKGHLLHCTDMVTIWYMHGNNISYNSDMSLHELWVARTTHELNHVGRWAMVRATPYVTKGKDDVMINTYRWLYCNRTDWLLRRMMTAAYKIYHLL